MRKLDFWQADWLLGVLVAMVVLALSGWDLIQSLERKAFDLGMQLAKALRLCLQSLSAAVRQAAASAPTVPATLAASA